MTEQEQNQLIKYLFETAKVANYKKGTVIIHEGCVSTKFYYLKKGLLRGWTYNDGKEITFQFLFEDQLFCATESFFYKSSCSYSIEIIEDSVLLYIDREEMDMLQHDRTFQTLFSKYLISRVASYQQLLISRIQDKPEIRYKKLFQASPEILLRIPQHYIASYLGITSVSLSRIRNRR
ncbi:Crp/Fnr family transcriptional regulator [Sphingobacterium thalpophilum]|uniref:Cyclic nucleotide-binding domain n=1 Tax=Sphingobacterium thalpophilum TaxID=259 RepID=A0A4U9VPP5_9SPHI|nr:Crp/Fnr family transcriptional regulator [Sphingobacterium thalpophilum]VTR48353.1 Cyclic nucleotide-binding domain [Sphingobacterium thalpophilum]